MPEWLKGTGCKPVGSAYAGSNPAPPTMSIEIELKSNGGFSYREAKPGEVQDAPVALAVHGFPTSSFLWREVLGEGANVGWRMIAPDLPGFGDSPPRLPGTWEHQVENLAEFHQALGLDRVVLVVHDWGGLIGLRWACENPSLISGLVVMDTGFFSDGEWHGLARILQTDGEGEKFMDELDDKTFSGIIRSVSPEMSDAAVSEYWKAFASTDHRQSHLDLYRSGDFDKLAPYAGQLAMLDVPSLIVWGEGDPFAPVSGAYRFQKELSDPRLVTYQDGGHFIQEDMPSEVASEIATFLTQISQLRRVA